MARVLWILVAVAAGITAAVLLTARPTIVVDGEKWTCQGVLVTAEARAGGSHLPSGSACDGVQDRWTWYAGGAALVCLVAGTGVAFRLPRSGADEEDETRQVSIDNR